MNETLLALVMSAIAQVESNDNHRAIAFHDGGSPSYGKHQIKLSTARQLGFQGYASDLWLNEEVNYEYARKYFLYQWERYGRDLDRSIAAYNAGSLKRDPETGRYRIRNTRYVRRVKAAMETGNE